MLRQIRKSFPASRSGAPNHNRTFATTNGVNDVVIVGAARTPIGAFQGSLSSIPTTKLGAHAIKHALERAGVDAKDVGEVYMGNVLTANQGQAPARQAALFAGLENTVPCTTVNKVCASGMKAVMFGAQSIMLGHQHTIVAGGMESMSNVPYYLGAARGGFRLGHGEALDGIIKDGLWDVYDNHHMGMCGERTSDDMGISREQQDDYAIESYRRATEAQKSGALAREIAPVEIPQRRGDPKIVSEDEEIGRGGDPDKVRGLRSAFKKDGTVTAANASKINDGAGAMVLMSAARAAELGLKPLARIRGFADAAGKPIDFPVIPSLAVPKALEQAGLSIGDIDYFEINEAFSVVALANAQKLNIGLDRLNVHGGGVSMGHPIGASGARITAALINVLETNDAQFGVASICNGGGGASAIVLERL